MTYYEFIELIKEKRNELNFTQEFIANKLNISRSKYNKIENAKLEINFKELVLISNLLDIDLNIIKKEKSKNHFFD